MKNLAILISGPPRNICDLLKRIDVDAENMDYKFSVFLHIWKSDGGTKSRGNNQILDINEIQRDYSWIKQIVIESPYEDKDYSKFPFEQLEEGQSNAAAIMGMFLGVNRLINSIKLNPTAYSHILRLRTDNVIINQEFFSNLSNMLDDEFYVSRNYLIPYRWVSDHIMLAPVKKFSSLWSIDNLESFFTIYGQNGANPERYLGWKARKLGYYKALKIGWIRYKDYHILYDTPRKNDPSWCGKIVGNDLETLFISPDKIINRSDKVEINSLIEELKYSQDRYSRPIFIKLISKLREFLL